MAVYKLIVGVLFLKISIKKGDSWNIPTFYGKKLVFFSWSMASLVKLCKKGKRQYITGFLHYIVNPFIFESVEPHRSNKCPEARMRFLKLRVGLQQLLLR